MKTEHYNLLEHSFYGRAVAKTILFSIFNFEAYKHVFLSEVNFPALLETIHHNGTSVKLKLKAHFERDILMTTLFTSLSTCYYQVFIQSEIGQHCADFGCFGLSSFINHFIFSLSVLFFPLTAQNSF